MRLYIIALIGIIFTGCETVIPVDLPEQEPKITINSLFGPDKHDWIIFVHGSKGMYDNTLYEPLKDATVNIYRNDVFVETATYTNDIAAFKVSITPVPGDIYTVKVDAEGMESAEATEYVPAPIKINDITINRKVRIDKDTQQPESDITINFTDPEGVVNYYGLKLNTILFDVRQEGESFKTKDAAFDDNTYAFGDDSYKYFCCEKALFSDELFDGKNYTITISVNDFILDYNDKLEIELYTVARSYYLYKFSSELQVMNMGNPFAEPVIVFNNITNGFGIFSTYSKDVITKEL